MMDGLRDWRPDVFVHGGDAFEAKLPSKHPKDARHKWTARDEILAFADQLREINDAIPDALRVWVYGNHDGAFFNYEAGRMEKDVNETIQDSFWRHVTNEGLLEGWLVKDCYKHEASWRIGQMTFRHGCDVSDAGLKQDLMSYCTPHGLHVSGHTHRPHEVTQLSIGKALTPFWWANTGCLVDTGKMHYMDRARKDPWGHGYLRGYVKAPGLKEGRHQYAGKSWDAEVVILRKFAENWAPNSLAR